MNSVFSAFKSSKSDGSIPSNSAKKLGSTDTNSYANLRHIREIGSGVTMSTFVELSPDDTISIASNLRLNKSPAPTIASMDASQPIELPLSAVNKSTTTNTTSSVSGCDAPTNKIDRIEQANSLANCDSIDVAVDECSSKTSIPSSLDQSTAAPMANDANARDALKNNHLSNGYCSATENKENDGKTVPSTNTSELVIDHPCAAESTVERLSNGHTAINDTNGKHTPVLSAATNRKSIKNVDSSATTPNKVATNRLSKRLSLSGLGNSPLPSVHGRTTHSSQNGGSCANGETKRTRISTHQRNLSLDFRWVSIIHYFFPFLSFCRRRRRCCYCYCCSVYVIPSRGVLVNFVVLLVWLNPMGSLRREKKGWFRVVPI